MEEHTNQSERDKLIAWHTAMANEPKRNEAKRQKHRATAALLAADKTGGEASEYLDVRKIMLRVTPDEYGNPVEVYAESVSDVEGLLSDMGQRLEEFELGVISLQPQPVPDDVVKDAERYRGLRNLAIKHGEFKSEDDADYHADKAISNMLKEGK